MSSSSVEFLEEPDPLPDASASGFGSVNGPDLFLTSSQPSLQHRDATQVEEAWDPSATPEEDWQRFVGARTIAEQYESRRLMPYRRTRNSSLY